MLLHKPFNLSLIHISLDSLDLTAGKAEVKLLFQVLSGSEKVSEVKWTVSSLKSQAWTENAVTWNNGPSVLSQQTTSPCFIPSKDWTSNFVTFDVTSYALSRYKSGAKDLSVYIYQNARATGGKGTAEFLRGPMSALSGCRLARRHAGRMPLLRARKCP